MTSSAEQAQFCFFTPEVIFCGKRFKILDVSEIEEGGCLHGDILLHESSQYDSNTGEWGQAVDCMHLNGERP